MNQKGIYLGSSSDYGWMDKSPERLAKRIQTAVDQFKESIPVMPDAIAFTGSSGAVIAFPLALRYKLPLIMVRKPHEKSHGVELECNTSELIKNFIIVDDFVCTGRTIRQILASIARRARRQNDRPPVCLGVYQWCEHAHEEEGRKFGSQQLNLYKPRSFSTRFCDTRFNAEDLVGLPNTDEVLA